jgi:hypothetical protein
MAIIYSYPYARPKLSDLIVGTVTYESGAAVEVEGNPTRSFTLSDVVDLVPTYSLISRPAGTDANIILQRSDGTFSAVNLLRGSGISIADNGNNGITVGNLGVLSVTATNTDFISMSPGVASNGNVSLSARLSATGTPAQNTYLRGDNTWSTPVLSITTTSSSFITLSPTIQSNGDVDIEAFLSATGTPSSSSYLRGDNTWATIDVGVVDSIVAGTGISVDSTDPMNPIVTNTLPDQTVVLTGSGSTTITGTYPSFNIDSVDTTYTAGTAIDITGNVITNTAPDQVVSLTEGSNITVTGTYPNFTIAATDTRGVVDSVVAGTAISVDNTDPANPIVTNTAPDQIVSLTPGVNVTITGTYPDFTIAASGGEGGGITSVVAGSGIAVDVTDPENPIVSNTAPDQTVTITGSGSATVTGTYPNFNVEATGTTYTAGSGISIDVSNVISNTAPDQVVSITGGGATTVTGTYPNFTVSSTDNEGVESIVAGTNISVDATDPANPIVSADPYPTVLPSDFVYISVKNETGNTIAKGTGVMAVGTDGNSGHVLIAPMVADGSVEPRYFVGVLDENILNGGIGVAVTQGEIDQLNTNAFLDSDILWCSPSTPGTFVTTEPSAPNLKIAAAIVLNSATNGKILVRVQGNEGLHELHDVGINNATLADGQLLTYDSTAGYWKNAANAAEARYTTSYISTNTTAVKDYLYVITASLTLTLPATPTVGDKVGMSNMSGTTTVVMGRNGENIAGIAEDLIIDVANIGIQFIYTGATKGWILI